MNKWLSFLLFLSLGMGANAAFAAKSEKAGKKELPPGLQMNSERGKPLPPGWEKKLAVGAVLDRQVFDHGRISVPLDDKGIITLEVEGRLLKLFEPSLKIVAILK